MGIKVVKFGGSSLADAEQFRKVAEIVKSDPDRRFVVASAPGKRYRDDVNIRMIDQGSSELNIIVGVEERDFDKAHNAIYHEFVK